MKDEETRIIFLDKQNLGAKLDAVKIYGDIKILLDTEKLNYNGKKMEYHQLRYRLQNGYWETENFLIRKTQIIKSTRTV
jgi:hypothetical protein